jgi:uncharacterized protein (UPF0335 family)
MSELIPVFERLQQQLGEKREMKNMIERLEKIEERQSEILRKLEEISYKLEILNRVFLLKLMKAGE